MRTAGKPNFSAISLRNSCFLIFPEGVMGNSSIISNRSGNFCLANLYSDRKSNHFLKSQVCSFAQFYISTYLFTHFHIWHRHGCATSTLGCIWSKSSISFALIFSPPRIIISFFLPVISKYPSGLRRPKSPVWNHPS